MLVTVMQKIPMCKAQHKKCYASKGAAISAALRYSAKRGTALRVYWHAECRSYHLTSMPKGNVA